MAKKQRNISVVKNADGKSIVMINDIRIKGKRCVNWDEVKEYLKEFIGDVYTIEETEDIVYI